MAGLLEFLNTPGGMGLLSAAAGGLAGARRGTPINNIGRGAVSGLMGYSNAQDQIRADEENAFAKQYKQLQMQQLEQQLAEQKAQQAWRAGLPDYLRKQTKYAVGDQQFGSQQEAQAAAMPNENTQLMAGAMGSQAAAQPVQEINAVRDPAELQAYLMQPGSPYADKMLENQLFPETVVVGRTLKNKRTGETIGHDETWKEEQAANREQRIAELQLRLEDQQLSREQNIALRRELAQQQEGLRRDLAAQAHADRQLAVTQGNKPPAGYRYKPNGDLEMIPGGPADIKNQARMEGGGTVDGVVASLRDAYDQLEKGGGITSTKNRAGTNIGAWAGSTGIGQTVGGMFGTQNQTQRDMIAQQRPILLQAIMKATGMSAKQMDSNAELKLYLATATDPTKSLQANRKALDMIEKLYGSGAGNRSITGKPAGGAPEDPLGIRR